MKFCKDCKHYEAHDKCFYHFADRTNLVDGGRSSRCDYASVMRTQWIYFWFWQNCGKSGRHWEEKK